MTLKRNFLIHLPSSGRPGDLIEELDGMNRDIIKMTIDGFSDESRILKDQNILFFYDWMDDSRMGRVYIKGIPGYEHFVLRKAYLPMEFPHFSDYRFIIYLSREVRENDNPIFKILTIAHELQHLLQYVNFRNECFQVSVLKGFFDVRNDYTNRFYRNIPHEIDAFRKSKSIAIRIFNESEVSSFLEKRIHDTQDDNEREYWENLKSLDLEHRFNLTSVMSELWEKYESEILSLVQQLETKNQNSELEKKEKDFVEAYEFYQAS